MPYISTRIAHFLRSLVALVLAAAIATAALIGASVPTADAGERGMRIDHFMAGLACIESGGRYDAVNGRSGALGKYQIMPRNWPVWANRYMRNRWAVPTPRNQEFVARGRIGDLYEKHGSWRLVAYWWLTGNSNDESDWTRQATRYVTAVMAFAQRAASARLAASVPERCFPQDLGEPRVLAGPLPRVQVTGGAVNVRRSFGYEYRSIGVVRRGDRLAVLGKGADARGEPWLRVGLKDGRTGWIARWFTDAEDRALRVP